MAERIGNPATLPDIICVSTDLRIISASWNWKYGGQVGKRVFGRILGSIIREFVTRDTPVSLYIAKVYVNGGPKGVKRFDTLED